MNKMNRDDLKDVLIEANNIAVAGIRTGQEIGERDAAAKAKPLLDALEAILDAHARNTLFSGAGHWDAAREAIAAYGKLREQI